MSIQPNIVPFGGFIPQAPDRTLDFVTDRNTNLHVTLKVEGKVFQDVWIEGTWGGSLVVDMPSLDCATNPFRPMIDAWLAVNDLPPGYPASTCIKIDGEEIDFNITPC